MDGRKVNVQKIVAAYGLEKEHRVDRTSKSLNHKKKQKKNSPDHHKSVAYINTKA